MQPHCNQYILTPGNATSQVLDTLKFPLAIAVVYIHSFGEGEVDMTVLHTAPFDMAHLYDWLRILVSRVITHVAVPIFYMISGYLFFINVTRWDKSTYAKRCENSLPSATNPHLKNSGQPTFFHHAHESS